MIFIDNIFSSNNWFKYDQSCLDTESSDWEVLGFLLGLSDLLSLLMGSQSSSNSSSEFLSEEKSSLV